ncbi:hypothetical protein BHE74_00026468 [Ensete ventricosum]|nr:hypothetical protein GW17_00053536 [Ensete ventricosum]RWW66165.1 hypothetical protein BHE74_00026468 [Ensete ventricosum]
MPGIPTLWFNSRCRILVFPFSLMFRVLGFELDSAQRYRPLTLIVSECLREFCHSYGQAPARLYGTLTTRSAKHIPSYETKQGNQQGRGISLYLSRVKRVNNAGLCIRES